MSVHMAPADLDMWVGSSGMTGRGAVLKLAPLLQFREVPHMVTVNMPDATAGAHALCAPGRGRGEKQ